MNTQPSESLEIETAFLATRMPDGVAEVEPVPYTDIYLSDDSDLLTKMRLRQKGDKYELTKKVVIDPSDLSTQTEYNVPLTEREFKTFKQLGGRALIKDRYNVIIDGRDAEVDVFKGDLAGLVLIEFEFSNAAERDAFTPSDSCGDDVTQEDFIAGAYLAGKTYADIEDELSRFNYSPIQ